MAYFIYQWRLGQEKTLTSLGVCDVIGAERVLFLTKKKAISSIEHDYKMLNPSFELQVINYESSHKINLGFSPDVVIADESHSLGAFPKPSSRAREIKS